MHILVVAAALSHLAELVVSCRRRADRRSGQQASVVLRGVDSDIAEVRNVEFEGSVGNDVDLDCDSTVYISDLSWSTGGGLVYNEECDL